MTRRYEDPVQVVRRQTGESEDGAPAMFLWRGRLYVVREVLGHWWERRAWWTGADARAVHGEVPPGGAAGPEPGRRYGGVVAGAPREAVARSGADREVWRVAASPGSAYGTGVYDLSEERLPEECLPEECLPEEHGLLEESGQSEENGRASPPQAAQAGDVRTACGEGITPMWRLLRVAD